MLYSSIHVENWRFVALFLNGLPSQVAHCCNDQIRSHEDSTIFKVIIAYLLLSIYVQHCVSWMTIMRSLLVKCLNTVNRKNAFFIQLHLNKWQASHQIIKYYIWRIFSLEKMTNNIYLLFFFIKKQKEYRKAIKEKNQNRVA